MARAGVVRAGQAALEAERWEEGDVGEIANRAEDKARSEATKRTDGITGSLRLFTDKHLSEGTPYFSVNTDFSQAIFMCQLILNLAGIGLLNLLFVKTGKPCLLRRSQLTEITRAGRCPKMRVPDPARGQPVDLEYRRGTHWTVLFVLANIRSNKRWRSP